VIEQEARLSEETTAALEILIAEIYDLNPNKKIRRLLESWVKANGLHPEKVQTIHVTIEPRKPTFKDMLKAVFKRSWSTVKELTRLIKGERVWVCGECRAEFKQSEISKDVNPYLKRCPNCGAFSWMPKELLEA
jgi:rubrerythrin